MYTVACSAIAKLLADGEYMKKPQLFLLKCQDRKNNEMYATYHHSAIHLPYKSLHLSHGRKELKVIDMKV